MKTFKEYIQEENNQYLHNPTQIGDDEDPILVKIRQYKGNIEDLKKYWHDRINQRNNSNPNR